MTVKSQTGLRWAPANPRMTVSSTVSRHAPETGGESHMLAASTPPNTAMWVAASYGKVSRARTGGS